MDDLLVVLREFDALRDGTGGDEVVRRTVDRAPLAILDIAELVGVLPPPYRSALVKAGRGQLYAHQIDAIRKAVSGVDLVLESPTASGKTLSFTVPMVLRLQREQRAHALMLHPMKALSNDQRRQLEELTTALPSGSRQIDSWLYDGDTEREHRPLIRKSPPAVLLTNPEMLHQSFLGWWEQWKGFLANLRVLVIDEMHEYRGFFGTNCALLIRRFLRKVAELGGRPQVILATATCANPIEHAQRLTGRSGFELIQSASAQRPQRHFAFINPSIPDFKFHSIYQLRIARAALACLKQGLATLVFCPSRLFAESVAKKAQHDAAQFGLDPGLIVPYRAGYTSDQRREIEEGMRSGKYSVVFCTNALEIGIDIGRLDCCILAGFPDNVMSAWQRIGRTGRAWDRTAYVLFYAMNSAIDQFFATNIDAFLTKPLDEILVGVDNEELIARHVPYVLSESDWKLGDTDRSILGNAFFDAAVAIVKAQKPVTGHKPSYQRLDIRGTQGGILHLKRNKGGQEVGSISEAQRFREAYVGAIYTHLGETFRVISQGASEIYLESADPNFRTEPRFWTVVQSTQIVRGVRFRSSVGVHYGKVAIYENFGGYKLIDGRDDSVVEEVSASAAIRREVRAFWIGIEDPEAVDLRAGMLTESLRVIEQFLRIGSPFVIPCDRHDMATLTSTGTPTTVYLHETVPGGIGIAEKMFDVWSGVLERGVSLAQACDCSDGCPRCIHPPRYRASDAGALRKGLGFSLARELLSIGQSVAEEVFDPVTQGWRLRG
ncbi:ATP-dependent helicase [Nitrospira sp.]|nr:ATP-dependent helicase [Nitrospira sp.]